MLAGLLRVDELAVDLPRDGDGGGDGRRGDLVEHHPAHRHLGVQRLDQVPGDGLALAVLICREVELVGVLDQRLELVDLVLAVGADHVERLEVVVDVDAEAGPRLALVLGRDVGSVARQFADVADRRLDDVPVAEVAADRLGLGRGLDDHQLGARPSATFCLPLGSPSSPVRIRQSRTVHGRRRRPSADGTSSRSTRRVARQPAWLGPVGQCRAAAGAGRAEQLGQPPQPLGRRHPPAGAAALRERHRGQPSRDSWAPAAWWIAVVRFGGGRAGSRRRRAARRRSPTAAGRRRRAGSPAAAPRWRRGSSGRRAATSSACEGGAHAQPGRGLDDRDPARPTPRVGERGGQRVGAPLVGDDDRQPRPGRRARPSGRRPAARRRGRRGTGSAASAPNSENWVIDVHRAWSERPRYGQRARPDGTTTPAKRPGSSSRTGDQATFAVSAVAGRASSPMETWRRLDTMTAAAMIANATSRRGCAGRPTRSSPTRQLDDGRRDQHRHQVHDLDQRVDRRAGGVLERVTDGVTDDGRRVGLGALAAVDAVLDHLLRVVPGATGVGEEDRHQHAGADRAGEVAGQRADAEQEADRRSARRSPAGRESPARAASPWCRCRRRGRSRASR